MDEKQLTEIFILLSVVAFLVAIVLVSLFVLFQNRKRKLLQKQKTTERRFEEEIKNSKIEIREETFRNISWELHDNIGQLITLAKLQIQNDDNKEEIKKTLSKALEELRALSKVTNPEALEKISFLDALKIEIDRFNRLNYLNAYIKIEGEIKEIDPKVEIVLFRILQEFFSNTMKHSKASNLDLNIKYLESYLEIYVTDNGIGFNQEELDSYK